MVFPSGLTPESCVQIFYLQCGPGFPRTCWPLARCVDPFALKRCQPYRACISTSNVAHHPPQITFASQPIHFRRSACMGVVRLLHIGYLRVAPCFNGYWIRFHICLLISHSPESSLWRSQVFVTLNEFVAPSAYATVLTLAWAIPYTH